MKRLKVSTEDINKLPHRFQVQFACFCARQVFHLVSKKNHLAALKAIEAAEAFVVGSATKEECRAAAYAAYAAYAAANAAAHAAHAAYAAAHAAHAAHAAYAAVADAYVVNTVEIVNRQWDYYNELLNFSENFEKIVLD